MKRSHSTDQPPPFLSSLSRAAAAGRSHNATSGAQQIVITSTASSPLLGSSLSRAAARINDGSNKKEAEEPTAPVPSFLPLSPGAANTAAVQTASRRHKNNHTAVTAVDFCVSHGNDEEDSAPQQLVEPAPTAATAPMVFGSPAPLSSLLESPPQPKNKKFNPAAFASFSKAITAAPSLDEQLGLTPARPLLTFREYVAPCSTTSQPQPQQSEELARARRNLIDLLVKKQQQQQDGETCSSITLSDLPKIYQTEFGASLHKIMRKHSGRHKKWVTFLESQVPELRVSWRDGAQVVSLRNPNAGEMVQPQPTITTTVTAGTNSAVTGHPFQISQSTTTTIAAMCIDHQRSSDDAPRTSTYEPPLLISAVSSPVANTAPLTTTTTEHATTPFSTNTPTVAQLLVQSFASKSPPPQTAVTIQGGSGTTTRLPFNSPFPPPIDSNDNQHVQFPLNNTNKVSQQTAPQSTTLTATVPQTKAAPTKLATANRKSTVDAQNGQPAKLKSQTQQPVVEKKSTEREVQPPTAPENTSPESTIDVQPRQAESSKQTQQTFTKDEAISSGRHPPTAPHNPVAASATKITPVKSTKDAPQPESALQTKPQKPLTFEMATQPKKKQPEALHKPVTGSATKILPPQSTKDARQPESSLQAKLQKQFAKVEVTQSKSASQNLATSTARESAVDAKQHQPDSLQTQQLFREEAPNQVTPPSLSDLFGFNIFSSSSSFCREQPSAKVAKNDDDPIVSKKKGSSQRRNQKLSPLSPSFLPRAERSPKNVLGRTKLSPSSPSFVPFSERHGLLGAQRATAQQRAPVTQHRDELDENNSSGTTLAIDDTRHRVVALVEKRGEGVLLCDVPVWYRFYFGTSLDVGSISMLDYLRMLAPQLEVVGSGNKAFVRASASHEGDPEPFQSVNDTVPANVTTMNHATVLVEISTQTNATLETMLGH